MTVMIVTVLTTRSIVIDIGSSIPSDNTPLGGMSVIAMMSVIVMMIVHERCIQNRPLVGNENHMIHIMMTMTMLTVVMIVDIAAVVVVEEEVEVDIQTRESTDTAIVGMMMMTTVTRINHVTKMSHSIRHIGIIVIIPTMTRRTLRVRRTHHFLNPKNTNHQGTG